MDRKKELKEQYKQMKPEMGILYFGCKPTGKVYLAYAKNIKGIMNGMQFKLMMNGHPYKNLQKEWNEYGEDHFEVKVLDRLDYNKDESKTDYTEELKMLLEDWQKKYPNAEIMNH